MFTTLKAPARTEFPITIERDLSLPLYDSVGRFVVRDRQYIAEFYSNRTGRPVRACGPLEHVRTICNLHNVDYLIIRR